MNKKFILIIEDNPKDFEFLKELIENLDEEFQVLPEDFDEMKRKIHSREIQQFVLNQIKDNYKSICTVICDMELGRNHQAGKNVIERIRNYKNISPKYWTDMVPIIAVTQYPDALEKMVNAGADFFLGKPEKDEEKALFITNFNAALTSQAKRFEKKLKVLEALPYPQNIVEPIERFKNEHKKETTAFIMTSFSENHRSIIKTIKDVLSSYGITGLKADDKVFTKSSLDNIYVYMQGCDFGIGVLTNIDKNKPANQNVAMEIGYMFALNKKVMIFKEKQMEKPFSDIEDDYWYEFDSYNLDTIKPQIEKFLINIDMI